jgi:hypothetical protein
MFYNATNFDSDLSQRNIEGIGSPSSLQYMLHNTSFSTYHYNAILDSRSKQNVPDNIHDFAINTTYGGVCAGISNAAAGISGRAKLMTTNSWGIIDYGEE